MDALTTAVTLRTVSCPSVRAFEDAARFGSAFAVAFFVDALDAVHSCPRVVTQA